MVVNVKLYRQGQQSVNDTLPVNDSLSYLFFLLVVSFSHFLTIQGFFFFNLIYTSWHF